MVIKIGKLIFPPIRDIFILVLIDYNTLHLTWALQERELVMPPDKSPDTELNYGDALIWSDPGVWSRNN